MSMSARCFYFLIKYLISICSTKMCILVLDFNCKDPANVYSVKLKLKMKLA